MFKRAFVALVGLGLGMSVLVLASSPAGAANTANEVLFNHDNNAATANVREFAGSNRYATSLAIAEAFARDNSVGGVIDTVIIASGESLVDAAAATGLAAAESAPVLLTPPDRLTRGVENFLVDEFITNVIITGGTASISQSVQDDIEALAAVRVVRRIAGRDRYETSVLVAEAMDNIGTYCETGDAAAILVNVDNSFADVIAVGPLSYALDLPILLTTADSLPPDVVSYLIDSAIDRVIVVGGTSAVSEDVVGEIVGILGAEVTRISGATRYDTALAIRQALADCSTVTLSPTNIALINGNAAADGVSAGPLLGAGLGVNGVSNGVTPVLLVDTASLPAPTRGFLARLPLRNAASQFLNVGITAIGGTAVVSDSVVQAAIAAATTSQPLTATIRARAGMTTATITFSASVNDSGAPASTPPTPAEIAEYATSAANEGNYRVGGTRLFTDDSLSYDPGTLTATLMLGDTLRAGDTISIPAGAISGSLTIGDGRRVEATTFTVQAATPDNVRPRLEIIASDGSHEFAIRTTETNREDGEEVTLDEIEWKGADLPVSAGIYRQPGANLDVVCLNGVETRYIVAVPELNPDNKNLLNQFLDSCRAIPTSITTETVTITPTSTEIVTSTFTPDPQMLETGDTIRIDEDAIADEEGNLSRATSGRVGATVRHPALVSATVSRATPKPGAVPGTFDDLASATWRLDSDGPDEAGDNVPIRPLGINVNALTAEASLGIFTLPNGDKVRFWLTEDNKHQATARAGDLGVYYPQVFRGNGANFANHFYRPGCPGPVANPIVGGELAPPRESGGPVVNNVRILTSFTQTDDDGVVRPIIDYTVALADNYHQPITDGSAGDGVVIGYLYSNCKNGEIVSSLDKPQPRLDLLPRFDLVIVARDTHTAEDVIAAMAAHTEAPVYRDPTPAEDRVITVPNPFPENPDNENEVTLTGPQNVDIVDTAAFRNEHWLGNFAALTEYGGTTPADAPGSVPEPWASLGGVAGNYVAEKYSDATDGLVSAVPEISITITGKADGVAAGAAGNDWTVTLTNQGAAADADTNPDVVVNVYKSAKILEILFDDGTTSANLTDALAADEDFTDDFAVSLTPSDGAGVTSAAALANLFRGSRTIEARLSGGKSQVQVTLEYDNPLTSFNAEVFAAANTGAGEFLSGIGSSGVTSDVVSYGPRTYTRDYLNDGTLANDLDPTTETTGVTRTLLDRGALAHLFTSDGAGLRTCSFLPADASLDGLNFDETLLAPYYDALTRNPELAPPPLDDTLFAGDNDGSPPEDISAAVTLRDAIEGAPGGHVTGLFRTNDNGTLFRDSSLNPVPLTPRVRLVSVDSNGNPLVDDDGNAYPNAPIPAREPAAGETGDPADFTGELITIPARNDNGEIILEADGTQRTRQTYLNDEVGEAVRDASGDRVPIVDADGNPAFVTLGGIVTVRDFLDAGGNLVVDDDGNPITASNTAYFFVNDSGELLDDEGNIFRDSIGDPVPPCTTSIPARDVNITSSIVFTIVTGDVDDLPERGDRVELPNSIARSYEYDPTSTDVTVNSEFPLSTTRYGESQPASRTLRRG